MPSRSMKNTHPICFANRKLIFPLVYLAIAGFLFIEIYSCSSSSGDRLKNESTDTVVDFRKFLVQFPIRQLPVKINVFDKWVEPELISIYKSPENIFLKENDRNSGHYWGMLPDTSQFFYLIYSVLSDGEAPVHAVYDKAGNCLDNKMINVGRCDGGGPCYSCTDDIVIGSDYSIMAVDTFREFICDDEMLVPDSSKVKVSLITVKGRITNGKIEIGKEVNITL